jgi:hypothetical protein
VGNLHQVDVDHPELDQRWNAEARSESEAQRLDRNWSSLLQELRVAQTGVQLLTGLLLTLPFQQKFDALDDELRTVYLVTVVFSLAATVLLVAPVGMHRMLFRRHKLRPLVSAAHRFAFCGLLLLGAALVGVAIVVFGAVVGDEAGLIAGSATAVAMLSAWVAYPLWMRHLDR